MLWLPGSSFYTNNLFPGSSFHTNNLFPGSSFYTNNLFFGQTTCLLRFQVVDMKTFKAFWHILYFNPLLLLRQELFTFLMPCIYSDSKGSNDKSKFELGERMSNEAVNINGEEYKKVKNLNFVQKVKNLIFDNWKRCSQNNQRWGFPPTTRWRASWFWSSCSRWGFLWIQSNPVKGKSYLKNDFCRWTMGKLLNQFSSTG